MKQDKPFSKKPAPPSRTATAATNLAVSNRSSKSKIWLVILFGVLLIFGIAALFFYFRTSSFVNETLGAYNASSLLTAIPTPTSTTTLQISPPASPLNLVTTPQPGKTPVLPVVAKPLSTPSPTSTADNSPTIIRRIKAGEKISLLVLGYGGEGHEGAYLTDTMLVITYDPAHKAVVMVNIPRDLYVLVPYAGPNSGYWGKINSAFSFIMEGNPDQSILSPRYRFFNPLTKLDAAANLAKDVVEEVSGIPIDYWATFSFDGFRRLIDTLGGVDVVVDKTFDDYEYPANDNPQIDASYKHIHFQAGLEHMNGERAIEFARSRKSSQDGTDFAGSKRQMKLVQAVKDKLAKPEMLLKTLAIMDALQGRMRTSLSATEVTALVDYLRSGEGLAQTKDLLFVSQILSSNFLYDVMTPSAGDILLPQAGQGNYKAIQDWLRLGLLSPQLRYEDMPIQLQNGTGLSGYGGKLTEELGNKGFRMLAPLLVNPSPLTQIIDNTKGKAPRTLNALLEQFPEAVVKTGGGGGEGTITGHQEEPALIVVLGKDYVTTSSGQK